MGNNHRRDEQILPDVVETLAWDTRIDDSKILVDVKDGRVTLTGIVSMFGEKTAASEDAWRIKGVREVANEIEVRPVAQRSDEDIAADVFNILKWDNRVDARNIVVKVAGGVVILSGLVGSAIEKRAAIENTWYTAGVNDVDDQLTISPKHTRPDGEIVLEVKSAITRDARITDPTKIEVEAAHGTVVLHGGVESFPEREAADEDAWFTSGVVNVVNELSIAPTIT